MGGRGLQDELVSGEESDTTGEEGGTRVEEGEAEVASGEDGGTPGVGVDKGLANRFERVVIFHNFSMSCFFVKTSPRLREFLDSFRVPVLGIMLERSMLAILKIFWVAINREVFCYL